MLLDILPVLLVIYIIFLAPGRYHEVLNPANSLHTGNNNVMALNIVLDGLHHLTILVEVELYALLPHTFGLLGPMDRITGLFFLMRCLISFIISVLDRNTFQVALSPIS